MKKIPKILSLLLIFSSLCLSSCGGDDDKTNVGVSTGDFFPLKTNNEWTYLTEEQSLTNLIKITGTTTFGGHTYYEYADNSEVAPNIFKHWFAKKGATYVLKSDDTTVNESGFTINIKSYEIPILKDDYEVNKSWTGSVSPKVTFSGNGQSGSLPFKVIYTAKNFFKGEVTLNEITYPNVIKSRIEININANGEVTTAAEEYWFAENVGIIKFVTYNADGTTEEKDIYNYQLN